MGKPKAPKPPDPAALAKAQGDANQQTAITQSLLNQVNQQTPWGSLSYNQRGSIDGVPQFTATTRLSPQQNQLFNVNQANTLDQQRLVNRQQPTVRAALNRNFRMPGDFALPNYGRLPGLPQAQSVPGFDGLPDAPEASDAVRQRVEEAMFERAKSRLDPMFEDRYRQLENQLVNQGFARGSEGYDREMEKLRRAGSDTYRDALQDSIIAGGQEQSRLFGMESQARQQAMNELLQQFGMGGQVFDQGMRRRQQMFGEEGDQFDQRMQRRQQLINERVLERNQPLNELLALMGRTPQIGMPQWAPTPQTGVGNTDVLGANALSQQAQQNAFQAQSQAQQGLMGGVSNVLGAGIGGWASAGFPALFGLSDPDAKEARKPFKPEQALEGMRSMPVDSWRYKGDSQRRVGPMADDWAKQFGGDGKTIDMVSAFGMSQAAIQALADKVDKLERQRG